MTSTPTGTARHPAGPAVLAVGALTAGVTIGNVYFAHPVLNLIADGLKVGEDAAGVVATVALFGYAAGLLLLVPLGDLLHRRLLIIGLGLVTTVLMLGASFAPSLPVLAVFAALAAVFTVVPQVLAPFIVELSEPQRRARALAWIQCGLITGMMLSRTIGGLVGEAGGWRAVYLLGAILTAVVVVLNWLVLPNDTRPTSKGYPALLASMPKLVAEEPLVRWASLMQGCLFAGFNALWTTLALLLTGPGYGYTAAVAGTVGLVGLTGAVAAPVAGKIADQIGAGRVVALGLLGFVISVPLFALGGSSLAALLAAIVFAIVGLQAAQVANQVRVLARRPAARGRLNTVYMVATFLFGAIGSAVGSFAFGAAGWTGTWLTVGGFTVLAAAGWLAARHSDVAVAPVAKATTG
jgi:predicted MFS family arabinose efflux permease